MKKELFYYLGRQDILPGPNEALMAWVLGAVWEHNRCDANMSLGKLHNIIKSGELTPHPLNVNINQLYTATIQAEKRGYLSVARNSSIAKIRIKLTPRACDNIASAEREAEKVTALAYEEWKQALISILGNNILQVKNIRELWNAVIDILPNIVDYLDSSFAESESLVNIEDWILSEHKNSRYSRAYNIATKLYLSLALNQDDSASRKLFNIVLLNALYAYRTTIPAELESRVSQSISNRVLLLDTNVLFALAGVTGDEVWEDAVRGFAKAASSLGFKLKYTKRTAEEYEATIHSVVNRLSQPSPSGPVYSLYWSHLPPSIERAFFQANLDNVHFKARYQDPEKALKDFCPSVKIVQDRYYDENFLRDIDTKHNTVYMLYYKIISEKPRKADKPPIVIEHDAKMAALVNILNNDKEQYYFVTADNALLSINSQYVLGIDQWFALYGPAISAVADYGKYLVDVISRTRFASFYIHPHLAQEFYKFISRNTSSSDRETVDAHLMYTHKILGHYITSKNGTNDSVSVALHSPDDYSRAIKEGKSELIAWDSDTEHIKKRKEQEAKGEELAEQKRHIRAMATKLADLHEEKEEKKYRIESIKQHSDELIKEAMANINTKRFGQKILNIVIAVVLVAIVIVKYKYNININNPILLITAIGAIDVVINRMFSIHIGKIESNIENIKEDKYDEIQEIKDEIGRLQGDIQHIVEEIRKKEE